MAASPRLSDLEIRRSIFGRLCATVAARKNILVAGGTSTGRTTLTNALLAEMVGTTDRVALIEDTVKTWAALPIQSVECQAKFVNAHVDH
jgi:Flp pilus assembly CpaF family ATPase